ncbi:hypothetical protein QTP88_001220 [Uroleucon formosanum]
MVKVYLSPIIDKCVAGDNPDDLHSQIERNCYPINRMTEEITSYIEKTGVIAQITDVLKLLSDHLNLEESESIIKICEDYADIFHLENDYLTITRAAEHVIRLPKDTLPIHKRPYRVPFSQQKIIQEQIEQMGRDDIIEKSMSQALNNVTINEFHPLPNITEILDQLGQSQLFSIVDLKSGYHQISLSKESRELTAFSTNQGHYHYKRMSMGLASAPSTFAKAMTNVMAVLIEPILQYPDFTKEFILTTDASGKALGAILSQGKIGSDLPISYASRTLNNAELNYSTTELECLAIIFGVKHFRPYLYGRKFIILTDHRPISWLFNLKDPLSKLARWRIELEQYNYEIKYKPKIGAVDRVFPRKQEDSIIFFEIFLIQLLSTEAISQTWITVELRSARFNSTTLGKPNFLLQFNYGEKIKQTE